MHLLVAGVPMNETIVAIAAGIVLVLVSMIGGGILYILLNAQVRDRVKREATSEE